MSLTSPIIQDPLDAQPHTPAEKQLTGEPVVVEVRGVHKTFRIPEHRVDSFKERAVHPLTRSEHRELHALSDVSFEIHKGEFFGIVGRNGSGKSTLLKILASIYRADAGRVRVAGRIAPFIELGVGFNPEMTALENGVLNGVLMGLTRREARRRLGEVIEFAELEDFTDLKVKNYSSGMMVRLAFSIMVQADADVMLIDEVLAVGDAAFAQKCMDVFHAKRDAGKTIVLVTHDMGTVQAMCHRAMLIEGGEIKYIGGADDTALRYYRENFAPVQRSEGSGPDREPVIDFNVRVVQATLRNSAGEATENVEQSVPISVDVLIEAARNLDGPTFAFHVVNEDGVVVFAFSTTLEERVYAGGRVRLAGVLENRLVAGRYYLDCWVRQDEDHRTMALQGLRLLGFVVYGIASRQGLVTLDAAVEASLEPGGR
jgi:ABC-2 type transport system ATP-binding protein